MGVTRLYSFMVKIDALRQVSISEEVQHYRRHTNQSPVVLVDAISLMYEVCRNNHLSYLCGGQLKEYKKHLEFVVEKFQKEGVELVFFFDGTNVMFNVDGWIKRKSESIKFVNSIFDNVEHGRTPAFIESNKNEQILPRNIFQVTVFVLKQKGCKVKLSLSECDKEIALYAKQNDCMGVLAVDTDFIIFDTVKTYTSIGMNLTEMKFYFYDKRKLLESVMLRSCELPLFASLAGNDFIPFSDLCYGFHRKFRKHGDNKNDLTTIFFGIANYIRRLNLKMYNSEISKYDIKRISRDVFSNEKKSELLQESINFYNLRLEQNGLTAIMRKIPDQNWCSIIKLFYDLPEQGDNFNIIAKSCFQDSICLEDFRCSDIPPSSTVLKQLRKKIYGILLFEKVGNKSVEEWIIDDFVIINRPHYVSPLLPNVHHPGLLSLLKGNDQELQWLLAGDVFNINPIDMKKLPKHLLIPALSFRYVKNNVKIDDFEISGLILSAVLANFFSAQELHSIVIHKVESRAIRIYTLVTRCFELVFQIFQILKNLIPAEMALSLNYQDGKLFHLIYNMSYDQKLSKNKVLEQVLDIFESKIKLFGTCKKQVDEIIAFIAI